MRRKNFQFGIARNALEQNINKNFDVSFTFQKQAASFVGNCGSGGWVVRFECEKSLMRTHVTILFIQQLKWHKVVDTVVKNKLAAEPFRWIPKPSENRWWKSWHFNAILICFNVIIIMNKDQAWSRQTPTIKSKFDDDYELRDKVKISAYSTKCYVNAWRCIRKCHFSTDLHAAEQKALHLPSRWYLLTVRKWNDGKVGRHICTWCVVACVPKETLLSVKIACFLLMRR